jgi:tripartite-type tricarboxylate transporter receptor subunit TctC
MKSALTLCFALAGAATLAPCAAEAAGAADFKGRTVTYIVATAPGGAYDGYGRLTARYMEKHLPGSTFVVVNRPGAGHMIGANMIYAAKPDGFTMGTFNMGVMYSQLVGVKAAQYDLGKMSWIGKAATDKRIIMVGAQTPYHKFEDLQAAKEPVPFAVSGVGSAAYSELQLLANVFDLNIKLLPGYSGSDDDMAIMRGEVVGKMGAITGQSGLVRDGRGRFLIQIGGARETGYGDMSYGDDVVKTPEQRAVMDLIASQGEMMRITVAPPKVPADRLEALRDAYRKAFTDPQLLADAEKLHYVIDIAVGEEIEKIVKAGLNQPPRIIAMLTELQNTKPANVTVNATLASVGEGARNVGFKDGSGEDVTAEISGSRSKIEIAGQDADRKALKPGMACAITYTGPGSEASLISCK